MIREDEEMAQDRTTRVLADHLHVARMSTYMAAAGGDEPLALQLYLWNGRMSAALFETLSVTEVIFRNAIDGALRGWNPSRGAGHTWEWTATPASPLNSMIRGPLKVARNNAAKARAHRPAAHPRKLAPINHDDLVAQLTFGVYAGLMPTLDVTDKSYTGRQALWRECLGTTFNGRPGEDTSALIGRVERLHRLRNRIAHAEPILTVNFASRMRDMVRLVDSINPALTGWVSGNTRVSEVMRTKP